MTQKELILVEEVDVFGVFFKVMRRKLIASVTYCGVLADYVPSSDRQGFFGEKLPCTKISENFLKRFT